jgi:hypothetical protein
MSKVKKSELKEIIKPIVEECIQESIHKVILESGVLSSVISEVLKATTTQPVISESQKPAAPPHQNRADQEVSKQISETKKRLMGAIGKDSYGGVNLFEGTTPAPAQASPHSQGRPLGDTDPSEPGVDITSIVNSNWSKLI